MESARYISSRFIKYTQHFITQLYFSHQPRFSTKGMGKLANQAQRKAQGILSAHRAATKATGTKSNIPQINFTSCPAKIEKSKNSSFDYWISFENPFSKKRIRIPGRSHKRLNHFLRKGWELSQTGELVLQKNGHWQARVYIQKEVKKAVPQSSSLGVDVGITHSVSRSDGYIGKGLSKIIKKQKLKQAERKRQGVKTRSLKTNVKQQLDIEARRAIARCKRDGLSLAVEDPKRLANLRSGKLQGWARSYFGNRVVCLAEEESIWVTHVNPAYSSQICSACDSRDKLSRVKLVFKCTTCGNRTHADINASRVIAQRARNISGSGNEGAYV